MFRGGYGYGRFNSCTFTAKSCCWGIPLKPATIIITSLFMLLSIAYLITGLVTLVENKSSKMVEKNDFGNHEVGLFMVIFGTFAIISSLIGIFGGIKEIVMPCRIFVGMWIILGLVQFSVGTLLMVLVDQSMTKLAILGVFYTLFSLIGLYFLYIVMSFVGSIRVIGGAVLDANPERQASVPPPNLNYQAYQPMDTSAGGWAQQTQENYQPLQQQPSSTNSQFNR